MAAGHVYPQRCDLSPDGRWLVTFILKAGARWDVGATYLAVSRLPWLTALAAWGTCGTWTRGLHFVDDRDVWAPGDPDAGNVAPLRRRYGLAATRAVTFAVERRRGWLETADTPARAVDDAWDEGRGRARHDGEAASGRRGDPAAGQRPVCGLPRHGPRLGPATGNGLLTQDGILRPLAGVQWADWDSLGRLLVATDAGSLEVRVPVSDPSSATWRLDRAALGPMPVEPPPEARRW